MGKVKKPGNEPINLSQDENTEEIESKRPASSSSSSNPETKRADPKAVGQMNKAKKIGDDEPSLPNLENVPLCNLLNLMRNKPNISSTQDGHYVHGTLAAADELVEFFKEIIKSVEDY